MHEAQNHYTALSDSPSHGIYFPAYELNISYSAPFFPVYTTWMEDVLLSPLRAAIQLSKTTNPTEDGTTHSHQNQIFPTAFLLCYNQGPHLQSHPYSRVSKSSPHQQMTRHGFLWRVCRNIHTVPTAQEGLCYPKIPGISNLKAGHTLWRG